MEHFLQYSTLGDLMLSQNLIVDRTSEWTQWWVEQRKSKLENQLNETMSVNPFMIPILAELHDLSSMGDIADLIIAAHLMTGHATGFGKLIDEKILPNVFGAKKLDSAYRKSTIYKHSCFDEIDHEITRPDGTTDLLSLKAGRWTIQLTMAVQLNTAFKEILDDHGEQISSLNVGVFYGQKNDLTDKYDILRGINRGANHDVIDLTDRVFVHSGAEFWEWLNDGEPQTQTWVMNGILNALNDLNIRDYSKSLLSTFKTGVERKYNSLNSDDGLDWHALLRQING